MVFIVYNDLIFSISVHFQVENDLHGCYHVSMVGSSKQDVFLVPAKIFVCFNVWTGNSLQFSRGYFIVVDTPKYVNILDFL